MHVLLLSAYFPPDTGSAAHLFYELGLALEQNGHRVTVVTGMPGYHAQGDLSRYRHRLRMTEDMSGLTVHRTAVPQVARNTPLGRGMWQLSCSAAFFVAGMRAGHKGDRPDLALVYSPPLTLGITARALRFCRGIPFVLNVQDLFPQSAIDLGLLTQKRLIRAFESLERRLYASADAVTVHSAGNRDHVIAKGGSQERTRVMQNSVDTEWIRPQPKDCPLARELGLEGKFVASFAGVMGFSQDLDVILEAARLLEGESRIAFLLVGDGVERERLVEKARRMGLKNVAWLPMQPRERYPEVLRVSDVCLTTLHREVATPVVPSKILSAMAAGRPVIAAIDESGDAPKLIAGAAAGLSVPPEDPPRLAEAIRRLFEAPALCDEMGGSGRQFAEEHLSAAGVAGAYESLFDEVTGARRRLAGSQEETDDS